MKLHEVNRSVFAVSYDVFPQDQTALAQLGGLAHIARLSRHIDAFDSEEVQDYLDREIGRDVSLNILHTPDNGGYNNYLPVYLTPIDCDELGTIMSGLVDAQVLGAAGLHRQITVVSEHLPSIVKPKGFEMAPNGGRILSEPWKMVTLAGSYDDIRNLGIDTNSPSVESLEGYLNL